MLRKYNPNGGIRSAAVLPVAVVSVIVAAELGGEATGLGAIFAWDPRVTSALWAAAAGWWYFNWRAFPVFYADGALRVYFRRFVGRVRLDPGTVVSIEPTAGPVNLFLRPPGWRIRIAMDEEREVSVFSFTDDRALTEMLAKAFPGRTKPRYPGT